MKQRYSFFLSYVLVMSVLITALSPQTALPQDLLESALKQPVNLAPKARRGDIQTYIMDIETIFLTSDGEPRQIKHDKIGFTQLCLANSPDTGLVYQTTIDSLLVGQKRFVEYDSPRKDEAEIYRGKTFTMHIKRQIPVNNGCYGFDIEFGEDEHFVNSFDLQEMFTAFNLIEQSRYTAGRQLRNIGDAVTIRLPAPICISIPEVINDYKLELSAFTLSLSGYTLNKGKPAALVSIQPHFARNRMDVFTPADADSLIFTGMKARWGEFEVRLDDGDIVAARLVNRFDSAVNSQAGDENTNFSRSYRTITITQLN